MEARTRNFLNMYKLFTGIYDHTINIININSELKGVQQKNITDETMDLYIVLNPSSQQARRNI